jgi:hypothetical protein
VESVVFLARALQDEVYDARPEKLPQAYNVALKLVNDGIVDVRIDGRPGFSFRDVAEDGSRRN